MTSTRDLAFVAGLLKAAGCTGVAHIDVPEHVLERARTMAGPEVNEQTDLFDLACAPELLAEIELDYGFHLDDEEAERMFALGTVEGLGNRFASLVASHKTAATTDAAERHRRHQAYLAQRSQVQMRSRMYRIQHLHQIRRKSRAYRRKVKRGLVRPKKRTGTAAGGYTLVPR